MKASDIVLIKNNTPLSNEERDTLINASYKVTKDSPTRIKRDINVIAYSIRIHDNRDILDDPVVLQTCMKTTNYYALFNIMTYVANAQTPLSKNERRFMPPEGKYLDPATDVFEYTYDNMIQRCRGKNFKRLLGGHKFRDFCDGFLALANYYCVLEKTGESKKVARFLVDSKFPIDLLPAEILHFETFLTTYLEKYGPEVSKIIIACMNDEPFTESQEEDFLKAIGTRHESLTEYILYEIMNAASKEDALFQLAAIKLYTKRLLKQNEIDDITLTFNRYHSDIKEYNIAGQYNGDSSISVFLVRSNLNKKEVLSTSLHEAYHKIQFSHIRNARLDLDSDVDVYSKDDFLRIHLGEDYYHGNYAQITYEDDARYKAELELFKIRKGTPKGLFSKLRRDVIQGAIDNRFVLKEIEQKTGSLYKTTRFHEGKKYPLDLLFDMKLKELHYNHRMGGSIHCFIAATLEENPIIGYEYNLTDETCERKDITEILYDYVHAKNPIDKNIYKALIQSYVDPEKHYEHVRNIKLLRRLLKDHSLNLEIREAIEECLSTKSKEVKYAKELRK